MKDIKTFLIGFLTCACMFLIMGQSPFATAIALQGFNTNNQTGRYQPIVSMNSTQKNMVDTATGEWYISKTVDGKVGWVLDTQFIK